MKRRNIFLHIDNSGRWIIILLNVLFMIARDRNEETVGRGDFFTAYEPIK